MSVLTGLEPAASRLPVEVPVSCNAALRSGDGTRTHGLLGMNQTICQLIYPAALPVFPGCQQLQRHLSYLRFSGGQTDNKRNRPYILLLYQLSYLPMGTHLRIPISNNTQFSNKSLIKHTAYFQTSSHPLRTGWFLAWDIHSRPCCPSTT